MQKNRNVLLLAVCLAAALSAGPTRGDPPGHGPILAHPETPRLAMPSRTKANVGYQVGGGNPFPHLAEPRRADEGTWGWDYQGRLLPRRVISGWWHGRRSQGGTGAYKTDGLKLFHGEEK